MRRIRAKKEQEISYFDSKRNIVKLCLAVAAVMIIVTLLMVLELGYGNFIVKNKTDLKLEYVNTSFVNTIGKVSKGPQSGFVKAGDTFTTPIDPINLAFTESNLEVRFKFENNKELFTDVGYFNDKMKGNLTVSFTKTEDPNLVKLRITAKNGIFDQRNIDCDEEFTVNLSEGKILE